MSITPPTKGEAVKGLLYAKGLRFLKLSPGSRTVAAMLGKPDYIPPLTAQIHVHAMNVAKADPKRFLYTDGRYCTGVQIAVSKWYNFESPYAIVPANYNYEVAALGGKELKSGMHMPSLDQSDPLIKNPEDIDKIKVPIERDWDNVPFVIDCLNAIEEFTGSKGAGLVTAPFSFICGIHSYVRVIRNIRKNPEFIHRLLTWSIDEVLLPYMELLREETEIDSFVAPDAWAVVPNINKMILEEFVFPHYRYFEQQAKKRKMTVLAAGAGDYCEENPERFDPEFMKWCWLNMSVQYLGRPALLMGMGQTQLWPVNLMKEFIEENTSRGWRPPVFANCSASYIRDVSPQAIADYIKKIIDNLGREGRISFMLPQVPADTPSVNVHTFVQAVKTFGKYPIPEDLDEIVFELPEFEPYHDWLEHEIANGRIVNYE